MCVFMYVRMYECMIVNIQITDPVASQAVQDNFRRSLLVPSMEGNTLFKTDVTYSMSTPQ